MSRGLGIVQREVLALAQDADTWVPLQYALGEQGWTEARRQSVHRAVRTLRRRGLIEEVCTFELESDFVRAAGWGWPQSFATWIRLSDTSVPLETDVALSEWSRKRYVGAPVHSRSA